VCTHSTASANSAHDLKIPLPIKRCLQKRIGRTITIGSFFVACPVRRVVLWRTQVNAGPRTARPITNPVVERVTPCAPRSAPL